MEVKAMKLIRNTIVIAMFAAAATLGACSHGTSGTSGTAGGGSLGTLSSSNDGTGKVGFALDLPTGSQLQQLNWTISGTGNPTYTGTVHIGDAQSVEFVQGGIQAGTYTISLQGTDTAGDMCATPTPFPSFMIVAGGVTQVPVQVVRTIPSARTTLADVTTGTVEVDAGVSINQLGPTACPGITSVTADPAEIMLGQASNMTVSTTGPASVIQWAGAPASGGG